MGKGLKKTFEEFDWPHWGTAARVQSTVVAVAASISMQIYCRISISLN